LDDGCIESDNNIAERALRGVAVGCENWLVAGSGVGGKRAAAINTVIPICKANGVDLQTGMTDVFAKIASDWPATRSDELMPWNWLPPVIFCKVFICLRRNIARSRHRNGRCEFSTR
jgi:transposase